MKKWRFLFHSGAWLPLKWQGDITNPGIIGVSLEQAGEEPYIAVINNEVGLTAIEPRAGWTGGLDHQAQ